MIAIGAAAALVISGCSGSSGSSTAKSSGSGSTAKLQTIRLASPTMAGDAIPEAYANATGLWKKFGLDVQIINTNTSVEFSEVGSGQADLAIGGPQGIQAYQKGAPISIVGGVGPAYVQYLVQQDIKSIDDLKGKKLGASAPGSTFDSGQEIYLSDKKKWTPPGDYTMEYFSGNFTAMVTALINNQIDGSWVGQPYLMKATAQNTSLHSIAQIDQTKYAVLLAQLITANSTWAKSHKSAIVQFIKAWQEATKEVNADPAKAAPYIAAAASVTNDEATQWIKDQGPLCGYFQISSDNYDLVLRAFAQTAPDASSVKFSQVIDNSFAKAAGVKASD